MEFINLFNINKTNCLGVALSNNLLKVFRIIVIYVVLLLLIVHFYIHYQESVNHSYKYNLYYFLYMMIINPIFSINEIKSLPFNDIKSITINYCSNLNNSIIEINNCDFYREYSTIFLYNVSQYFRNKIINKEYVFIDSKYENYIDYIAYNITINCDNLMEFIQFCEKFIIDTRIYNQIFNFILQDPSKYYNILNKIFVYFDINQQKKLYYKKNEIINHIDNIHLKFLMNHLDFHNEQFINKTLDDHMISYILKNNIKNHFKYSFYKSGILIILKKEIYDEFLNETLYEIYNAIDLSFVYAKVEDLEELKSMSLVTYKRIIETLLKNNENDCLFYLKHLINSKKINLIT